MIFHRRRAACVIYLRTDVKVAKRLARPLRPTRSDAWPRAVDDLARRTQHRLLSHWRRVSSAGHKAANCPMRGAVAKTLTQSLNCRGSSETDLKILDVCRSRSVPTGARMKNETAYHLKCSLCEGTGWVCVLHRDHPWNGPRACGCGVTGVPCPSCNFVAGDELPRMPPGVHGQGNLR